MKELNILDKYKKNIPLKIQTALDCISSLASEKNINTYLIGGVIRDIILKKQGFDIDVTLETNAIEFAKDLEKYFSNCTIKETHEDFKTAKVIFEIENSQIEIDIASTRKESYQFPAALPSLEKIPCSLKEDVERRDFSINTLAMSLNKGNFGELKDYLNGFEDIEKKQLKILHENSFVDDPTRILRMLKFSIRFGFDYEKSTEHQMQKVLKSKRFDNLGSERIKLELKQIFNLNSVEAFERIIDEDIYRLININIKPEISAEKIKNSIEFFDIEFENIWLIYLAVLLSNLEKQEIEKTAQSLNLNNFEKKVLQDAKNLFENPNELSSNYDIYSFFKNKEKEAIVAYGAINNEPVKKYLKELKFIKIETTGDDLLKKGVKQGKEIGIILESLLKVKLNNEIKTKEDEENYLTKTFNV